MIFSMKELVTLPLCYIFLMVSLSKCEIDSSSAVTTTTTPPPPSAPQPVKLGGEEREEKRLSTSTSSFSGTFSIPSSTETGSSYSSSSSSFKDVDVAAAAAVVFNNTNKETQQQHRRQQQQADDDGSYNANIISGTITPSAVSPILTLPVLPASEQEVGDSDREEVEREKQGRPQQTRFVTVQNQGNSNNEGQAVGKGETLSSSFGASQAFNYNVNRNAKYYEKMSGGGVGSQFPERKTVARVQAKPETITGHSIDSLTIKQQQPISSLPRRQAARLPGFVANKDRSFPAYFSTSENNESVGPDESENDSSVPTHTWIPAGLTFSCKNRVPGYYADASSISKCQVYHMCMTDGRKYTLLCGIGTVFNQLTFVCDHWYNYKCAEAESDYEINRRLWEGLVGDEEVDKDEDELEDSDQNVGEINENDTVHQSMPLRSPFTITSKISKTRDALS